MCLLRPLGLASCINIIKDVVLFAEFLFILSNFALQF